jgi:hypothetical protein
MGEEEEEDKEEEFSSVLEPWPWLANCFASFC